MFVFATTVNIKKSKEKENVCMILKYSKIDRRDNLLIWYKKNNGIPKNILNKFTIVLGFATVACINSNTTSSTRRTKYKAKENGVRLCFNIRTQNTNEFYSYYCRQYFAIVVNNAKQYGQHKVSPFEIA